MGVSIFFWGGGGNVFVQMSANPDVFLEATGLAGAYGATVLWE